MAGITIIDVKVVGICSKCRKEGDDIPKNKDGSIIPDEDISCVNTALGDSQCQKKNRSYDSQSLTPKQLEENKRLTEVWKEIIETATNGDPKHSYMLFYETVKFFEFVKCTKDDGVKDE